MFIYLAAVDDKIREAFTTPQECSRFGDFLVEKGYEPYFEIIDLHENSDVPIGEYEEDLPEILEDQRKLEVIMNALDEVDTSGKSINDMIGPFQHPDLPFKITF